MSKQSRLSVIARDPEDQPAARSKRNSVIQIGFLIHDVSRLRHSVFDLHV